MTLILEEFHHPADVPATFDPLFETGSTSSLFLSRDWFDLLATKGLLADQTPLIITASKPDGEPLALFPGLMSGKHLTGMSNYYSLRFAPLLANDGGSAALESIARSIAAKGTPAVQMQPFAANDPSLAVTERAFAAGGFRVSRFLSGTSHFLPSTDLTGAAYEQSLPSRLRNTIARRGAGSGVTFRLFSSQAEANEAMAFYESVYARSWKPGEPDPAFMPALADLCGSRDSFRLGVLFYEDTPAAVQFWIVEGGRASVFKLAHDEAYASHSPGSALSLAMFKAILDRDKPDRIDFGIGDEGYKADWMPQTEPLIGLAGFNLRTARGRLQHLHHAAGRLIKRRNTSAP
ncbi:MAG: GNAT family N-acetyltransferase [Alphaproteobacteria bacterium]